MNMHAPQSVQAETELKWLPAIPWQIISPAKNSPVIGIFQDSLLGSYYFTRPHVNITPLHAMELLMQYTKIDPHALQSFIKKQKSSTTAQARKLKASGKEYTLSSFDILSQICPPMTTTQKNKLHNDDKDKTYNYNNIVEIRNGHYVRGQLEKSMFSSTSKGILHRICNDFGNRTCADFIDDLQDIINEYMKTASFSVGISDLISDRQTQMEITKIIEKQKQEVQQLIEKVHLGIFENKTANSNSVHFELEVNNYLNKALEDSGKTARNSLGENNRFVMIVNSGSKGQPQNISQMISCFGQQNVDGKRVPNGYDNRPLPHFCKYDDTPKARGFIENSYITGFTAVEMFYHAMGGRLGLIDTAVKSVTWETPIVIIENKIPKYTEIGKWIDAQLDATPDKVEHHKERNLELLNTTDVYIPTTDEHGVVTWGEVTAITRHDPGSVLYEIKTQGGRSVIVTESKSLLIWNPETKEFHEKLTPEIKVGDGVPVTAELCQPPVTLSHINLKDYLPKTEYVYGSDFNTAVTMMQNDMKDHHKIAQGWWTKHNGTSFTLPYTKKASLQRSSIRSNIDNIKEGFIYPYGGIRKDTSIKEQFELNEENGIFIGLFLSEGNVYEKTITITNNNENVRDFVKQWFNKHSITYKETQRQNKIGGLTTTVVGNSCVLGRFLTKLVGHGAEHKHIPSEAYIAPESFIIGLLNGYFSGDGTISKNSVEASSASKRLIEDINMLCSRLGIFGKVFKTQIKSNNLNTKKILPSYRISIRAQWAKRFAETVPLLEEKKQQKLQNLKCKNNHRNFETHNHVVVDKIVEINLVDVKDHPKVYDLTIPSTLNFGLANGLQVRDTATTGYIQRRWVKAMEDLVVRYDMTVRNNMNKIIQFKYGDDCVDPVKVEGQYLALLNWNLKEIYDHYDCIGINDQSTEEMEIYTKSAQSRLKNQRQEALDKSHQYIENMIETRDVLVEKVFRGKDEGAIIKLPVMFKAIIENLQGQLGLGDLVKNKSGKLMSKNSQHKKMEHLEELEEFTTTTDVTPLECYQMVENFYETRFKTMGKAVPNRMFELFYYFYLTPKHLLVEKRFHKKALEQLLEMILLRYKQAIVHPGEAVGVIAGQSAGELSTQASLNSFHTAGGKLKKSNMTTGVPRIEELLQLTRSPKTPSLTIYLKPNDELSSDRAEGVSLLIGYMKLSEIVKGVKIMFDPRDDVIPEDNLLIKRYLEFEQQILDCTQADPLTQDGTASVTEPTENTTKKRGKKAAAQKTQQEIEENKSKWVIRLEFDAETMLNKNITMDDVYFVLSRQYGDKISCIYSDYNASNLIFRIRLDNDMFSEAGKKKSGAKSLDRMDDIYILKNFQTQLLNNTVLRGIPGIVNVIPRELRDTVAKEDGKYVKKNTWILDTTGSNLLEVCGLDFIDPYRTYSNNVREVAEVLGMEAAVQVLTMEMSEVLPDINYHHLSLIVDKMCSLKQMCPVCRGGIFADNVGPLMKSSFEMHSEVLLNAARHGEFDNARGVSANVMLGQTGYFGTSAFQVFLDMKKMQSLKEAQAQLSDSRDQLVAKGFEDVLDKENACSKSQVSIQNHLDILAVKDSGKVECVDGYDMGF